MKCPYCLAVCLEDDPACISCHRSLLGGPVITAQQARRRCAVRMAMVLTAFGACLGPVALRAFFPHYSRDLFDQWSLLSAGCGAALGGILGFALGGFVFEFDGPPTAAPVNARMLRSGR